MLTKQSAPGAACISNLAAVSVPSGMNVDLKSFTKPVYSKLLNSRATLQMRSITVRQVLQKSVKSVAGL